MTITSINDLRGWFMENFSRGGSAKDQESDAPGKASTSPYWTLYSMKYGEKNTVVAQNISETNADDSFSLLAENIRRLNNPEGRTFRIFQTWRPKHNFATAECEVQIYNTNVAQVQAPGIAGMGTNFQGYVSVGDLEKMFQEREEKWTMKREIEDLKAALDAPSNWMERMAGFFEQIANTPVGQALAQRILMVPGAAQFRPQSPINGTPEPNHNDGEKFEEDIQKVTELLGVNEFILMEKLRKLVEQNTDVAKSMLI
ncbi:MAG: hypothetical protein ACRC78_04130 [Planktothrix sp.]